MNYACKSVAARYVGDNCTSVRIQRRDFTFHADDARRTFLIALTARELAIFGSLPVIPALHCVSKRIPPNHQR